MVMRVGLGRNRLCNVSLILKGCFRQFSTVLSLIQEGRLREIDAFATGRENSPEYDKILEAYSLSHSVNIPVHRIHGDDLASIDVMTIEKMLATSLLCNHRGTCTALANELCRREENIHDMVSSGHIVLAFFADNQLEEINKRITAESLFKIMQVETADILGQNPLLQNVVDAIFKSWIKMTNVQQVVHSLELLMVAPDIPPEKILTGSHNLFVDILTFLRRNGQHNLCQRLLSITQHNLQRNLFVNNEGHLDQNNHIHNLLAFSSCLREKDDLKYLSNIFDFYANRIFHKRSYVDRLKDVEIVLTNLMIPFKYEDKSVLPSLKTLAHKTKNDKLATLGYQFYVKLRRKQNNPRLCSANLLTQVAFISDSLTTILNFYKHYSCFSACHCITSSGGGFQ